MHVIDANGHKIVDICKVCAASLVPRHSRHVKMCIPCGRLYARYERGLSNPKYVKDSRLAASKLLAVNSTLNLIVHKEEEAMEKQCKQCGRDLEIEEFRRYVPRGTGVRQTTIGYHTVCRACENFNQSINGIYKMPVETRTEAQQQMLDRAATLYKSLAARGLEPKGRYATDIVGKAEPAAKPVATKVLDYFEMMESEASLLARYQDLLVIEMTDVPDVYQDALEDLRVQSSSPDGKLRRDYRDIFNQVATRFDDYEDNYNWE